MSYEILSPVTRILKRGLCIVGWHFVNHDTLICESCKNSFTKDFDKGIPYYRKSKYYTCLDAKCAKEFKGKGPGFCSDKCSIDHMGISTEEN
jgi:hypothetical protein